MINLLVRTDYVGILKVFSGEFGDDVVQSISKAFNKGDLSICQKRGIITLLPKKDKPTDALNKLSPVTLLNVEDKIGTNGIPKRLAKVLREIVSPNGYVRDKYIGQNVRVISVVIEITLARRNQEELQLSSTLKKAFDSIEWEYLSKVLEVFNFKEYFRRWVKVFLY